jgi:hypothetical protein
MDHGRRAASGSPILDLTRREAEFASVPEFNMTAIVSASGNFTAQNPPLKKIFQELSLD